MARTKQTARKQATPAEKLQENKLETKLLENQLQSAVESKNPTDIDQELLL